MFALAHNTYNLIAKIETNISNLQYKIGIKELIERHREKLQVGRVGTEYLVHIILDRFRGEAFGRDMLENQALLYAPLAIISFIFLNMSGIILLVSSAHLTTHCSNCPSNFFIWASVVSAVILSRIRSWHDKAHRSRRPYQMNKKNK